MVMSSRYILSEDKVAVYRELSLPIWIVYHSDMHAHINPLETRAYPNAV